MRYVVELGGESVQVELRRGGQGLEAAVNGGPFQAVQLRGTPAPLYSLTWGGTRQRVAIEADVLEPGSYQVRLDGSQAQRVTPVDARTLQVGRSRAATQARGPKVVKSAIPGVIVELKVAPGSAVEEGELLLVLEAMKMQNEIRAPQAGTIDAVHVEAGASVPAGGKLVTFRAEEEAAS